MTINQLKYFSAVCDYGNISRAAEALYVSQPSVSLAVKELEEEFGCKLFLRNNNRLQLTMAGETLKKMADDLLAQARTIENTIPKLNEHEQHLTIGMFPDLYHWAFSYLRPIMDELRARYSNVDLRLYEISSFQVPKVVVNHEVDVLFCNSSDYDRSYGLGVKKIAETPITFCMRDTHPLAKEPILKKEMLKGYELIGDYYDREAHELWVRRFFADCDFVPETRHFFLQGTALHDILLTGDYFCVSRPFVNGMPTDGIAAIPVDTDQTEDILLLYDNRYALRNIVADFVDLAHTTTI